MGASAPEVAPTSWAHPHLAVRQAAPEGAGEALQWQWRRKRSEAKAGGVGLHEK